MSKRNAPGALRLLAKIVVCWLVTQQASHVGKESYSCSVGERQDESQTTRIVCCRRWLCPAF